MVTERAQGEFKEDLLVLQASMIEANAKEIQAAFQTLSKKYKKDVIFVISKLPVQILESYKDIVTFWGNNLNSENNTQFAMNYKNNKLTNLSVNGPIKTVWNKNETQFFIVYVHSIKLFENNQLQKGIYNTQNQIIIRRIIRVGCLLIITLWFLPQIQN